MNTALIVEDSTYMRHVMKRRCPESYQTREVGAAEEAELLLEQGERFSLVMLDLHLPGRPGLDVLKKLRATDAPGKPTPVLVMTGDDRPTTLAQLAPFAPVVVLLKPSPPDRIDEGIKMALESVEDPQPVVQSVSERSPLPLHGELEAVTNRRMRWALDGCDGSVSEAARQLGVSRETVYRWLREKSSRAVQ